MTFRSFLPALGLLSFFFIGEFRCFELYAQSHAARPKKTEGALPAELFEQSGDFQPINRIDELLVISLRSQGVEPAPRCSDAVFVRRIYLDLIGTLPTEDEVRRFLEDKAPDKRAVLIDTLLEREEFIDYWTMKWCDVLRVKAEYPINLWPNGALCYYNWIREAIRTGMPYDRFARELLLADGSNFRDGASNFYRAVQAKDAETLAETVAQTFLGTRIGPWPEEERARMAVFFSRVAYKETAEWKEEIVYWDRCPLEAETVIFPDGSSRSVPANVDPRQLFADWLVTPENKGFNRNMANRIWFWLLGRGLVHEPDDFNDANPPTHPEILDYLAAELVESGYDLKRLYRLIACSATYQQSSIVRDDSGRAEELFAVYPVRRLEAEVMQDALARIFNIGIGYRSEVPEPFTMVPQRYRTILLPDASVTSPFLEMFGRSTRDTGLESDRNNGVTESQQLFMLNSTEMNEWVKKLARDYRYRGRRVGERPKVLDSLWLRIVSRYPGDEELRRVVAEFREADQNSEQVLQDLIWALLNTKEFQCRH